MESRTAFVVKSEERLTLTRLVCPRRQPHPHPQPNPSPNSNPISISVRGPDAHCPEAGLVGANEVEAPRAASAVWAWERAIDNRW